MKDFHTEYAKGTKYLNRLNDSVNGLRDLCFKIQTNAKRIDNFIEKLKAEKLTQEQRNLLNKFIKDFKSVETKANKIEQDFDS